MMPGMQANLVSRTQGSNPTRGVSSELAGHLRREYGANAAFAHAMLAGAKRGRSVRRRESGDLLGRFVAAIWQVLALGRASPGGA